MALIEDVKISIEVSEDGRIKEKRLMRILRTNDTNKIDPETGEVYPDEVVSEKIWRGVINTESKDYQTKLQSLAESVIGQLAIQQELIIQSKNAEKAAVDIELSEERNACDAHLKTIDRLTKELETLQV